MNPTRIGSLSKERLEDLQQISSTKKKYIKLNNKKHKVLEKIHESSSSKTFLFLVLTTSICMCIEVD